MDNVKVRTLRKTVLKMAESVMFTGIPSGIPIASSARIRPVLKSDKLVSSEKVTKDGKKVVIGLAEKDSFEFDYVYGNDASQENIYERDIDRWLKTVVQGYNGAIVAFGETGSGKTFSLEGNLQSMNGIIPLAIRNLFFQLREKVKLADSQKVATRVGQSQNTFQVSMQFYEIFNDEIHDLLDPSQTEFKIEYSEYGIVVRNLASRLIRDENEFLRMYYQSVANRTQASCEFGLLAPRSSCFLVLDILQVFGQRNERAWSKMNFVELPGAEKLLDDPNQLRAREGPTLNKEIIAIGSLIRSLSNETQVDYANYNQSKTTMFLEEILGGNCVTIALVCLSPDIFSSRVTLQYAQLLKLIQNYPIVNEERTQGLMRKKRLQIFHLKEELHVAETSAEEKILASTHASETEIVELHGKLVHLEEDRMKLSEEKRKLYSMYMDFRTKYAALVDAKTKLQADLIHSEEERLNVTKLLIDMQIESNELKEQAANEKFKLETRMLNMESEYAEHQAREQKHLDEKRTMQKAVEEAISEKKDMELEFVSLKQNFIHLSDDLNAERIKADRVAVEMLNLINAKNTLESENQKLQIDCNRLQSRCDEMQGSQTNVSTERYELIQQLAEMKSLNEKNSLDLIRKEVEMKSMYAEYEAKKTSLEKSYIDYTREKDLEFMTLKNQVDKEQKKIIENSREFELEKKNFAAEVRSLKRVIAESDAALQEANTKTSELTNALEAIKSKSAKVAEQFRTKLLQYMNEVTDLSTSVNNQNRSGSSLSLTNKASNAPVDLQPAFEKMYKEVLKSHRDREIEVQEDLETEKRTGQSLARKLKSITNQYRLLRDHLLDIEPTGSSNRIILNDEDLKNVQEEIFQGDKKRDAEILALQQRLIATEADLNHCRDDLLKAVDVHSKTVAASARTQNALHEEISLLKRVQDKMDPMSSNIRGEHDRSLQAIQNMQKEFKEQLETLAAPRVGTEMANLKDTNERLRKENTTLREENRRLRDENSSLQADYADARAASGGASSPAQSSSNLNKQILQLRKENSSLKSEIEELRVKLKKSSEKAPEKAAAADDGGKPSKGGGADFEKERANLRARTMQAEEELKNFQETFQTEIMKKEVTISKLKQEVTFWKTKAGG